MTPSCHAPRTHTCKTRADEDARELAERRDLVRQLRALAGGSGAGSASGRRADGRGGPRRADDTSPGGAGGCVNESMSLHELRARLAELQAARVEEEGARRARILDAKREKEGALLEAAARLARVRALAAAQARVCVRARGGRRRGGAGKQGPCRAVGWQGTARWRAGSCDAWLHSSRRVDAPHVPAAHVPAPRPSPARPRLARRPPPRAPLPRPPLRTPRRTTARWIWRPGWTRSARRRQRSARGWQQRRSARGTCSCRARRARRRLRRRGSGGGSVAAGGGAGGVRGRPYAPDCGAPFSGAW